MSSALTIFATIPFITVAAGHLITHFQFPLHGQVNLREFQHTCWQFITNRNVEFSLSYIFQLFVELDIVSCEDNVLIDRQ
jgi:hypothetical protein